MLSMGKLIDYADCVLPIENEALLNIYNRIVLKNTDKLSNHLIDNRDRIFTNRKDYKPKAFDSMNNIVANLLMNITRFYS